MRSKTLAAFVAGAALFVGATSCGSDDISPTTAVVLTFNVTHPDHPDQNFRISCTTSDVLTYEGADGFEEFPNACKALMRDDVRQRLISGPPEDQVCTAIYGGPDRAHITGTIDDARVDTVVDRTNGCGIADWDDLLADVLPPAYG